MNDISTYLSEHGVRPTANRILVYQYLAEAHRLLSLRDIEEGLVTLDKSSIFRALTVMVEHDVLHSHEDGRGILHYEPCRHEDHEDHREGHLHFYCEVCQRSYCIEDVRIPEVQLPEGYEAHTSSWMIKGVCPECRKQETDNR